MELSRRVEPDLVEREMGRQDPGGPTKNQCRGVRRVLTTINFLPLNIGLIFEVTTGRISAAPGASFFAIPRKQGNPWSSA